MPQDIFDTLDSPAGDIFDEVYETGGFAEAPPEIGAGPAEISRGEEYIPSGPQVELSTWRPQTLPLPAYGLNIPPAITPSAPLEQPFLLAAPDTRGILERTAAAVTPTPETVQAAFDVMEASHRSSPTIPGTFGSYPNPAYDPQAAQEILESPTVPTEAAKATSAVLDLLNRQTFDPANIALMAGPFAMAKLGVAPGAVDVVNRMLQGVLSGRALAEAPEAATRAAEAYARGVPSEYIPEAVGAGLDVAMGLAGGRGALPRGPVTLRELARRAERPAELPQRPATAEEIIFSPEHQARMEAIRARAIPEPAAELAARPGGREMQTFDSGGPIEVLSVDEATGRTMVRDHLTGETREQRGEIFETPKRPSMEEPEAIAEAARLREEQARLPQDPDVLAAIESNRKSKLISKLVFSETMPDGTPIAGFTLATIDPATGNILIHPGRFLEWLNDPQTPKSPEGRAKAIRGLIAEEGIHGVVQRLMNQGLIARPEIEAIWDKASALQKGFTNLSYTGQWSGRGHNSYLMGHELLRREMQRLMKMKPREVTQLRGGKRFKAEVLDLAERAIVGVEGAIVHPNPELKALIKRTKDNIALAREVIEAPTSEEPEAVPAAEMAPKEIEDPLKEARDVYMLPHDTFMEDFGPSGTRNLTSDSWKLGDRLKTKQDVAELIRLRDQIYTEGTPEHPELQTLAYKGQYVSEAIQRATGIPESKQNIYRRLTPGYEPSVPMSRERFAELEAKVKAKEVPAAEMAREEKAAEVPPLRPALLIDGKPEIGTPGETHSSIFNRLQKAGPEMAMNSLMAFGDDANHVFVDPSGNVLNRAEAGKVYDRLTGKPEGTTTRLHSQELAKLQARAAVPEEVPAAYMPKAAEEEVRREPITPVAATARKHIEAARVPSFEQFSAEAIRRHGEEARPQLKEAWRDEIWNRLTEASDKELMGLVRDLHLRKMLGDENPEYRVEIPKELPERLRQWSIARVAEKLIAQSEKPTVMALERKSVEPSELAWGITDPRSGDPWIEFSVAEQGRADLGERLSQGSHVRGETPGITRRIAYVRDNETGAVDALAVYDHKGIVFIRDPQIETGRYLHVPFEHFRNRKTAAGKPKYTVLASALLDNPVRAFRQGFGSEKEWRTAIGDPAHSEMMARAPTEPPEAVTEMAIEPTKAPISLTDTEAMSLWEHFASEEAPSVAEIRSQFDALRVESRGGDRPTAKTLQIARALDKIYQQTRRDNPKLSPEEAMERVLSWIHENTGKEATRSGFVEKALGQFARRGAEVVRPGEAIPTAEPTAAPPIPEAARVAAEVPAAEWEGAGEELRRTIGKLERTRRAFGTLFSSRSNRKIMDQTFDAAGTMANIAGRQAGKHVRIGITEAQDRAASAVIAAGFDPSNLPELLRLAIRGNHKLAEAAVRLAMNQWNEIVPIARRGKSKLDAEIVHEHTKGINTEYHEDYLPGVYDMDLLMGSGRPYVISGRGMGIATGFKKGKTYPTPFHAIGDGYKPKSLKLSDLVEHRVKVGQQLINRKGWADGLKAINDPTDDLPIVTNLIRKQRGPGGDTYEVAPMGYKPREIIPGVRIAVHEGYTRLFDALTGASRISGSIPGQLLLGLAGGIKHGLLAFDTFHASRMMQKELFLTGKISYKKGYTLLDYADADLNRAVAAREITQEMADWVRANRPTAELLTRNGLNVGRIQEGLYNHVIRDIPVLRQFYGFSKWVFEKVTRGAMMEAGLIEFERISRARPDLSPNEVARKVVRDLNVYFGNLGSQGFFKSRTMQDIARIVALAPNWVESMARTEVLGTLQGVKGITYDPIVHRTILMGSVGKGVAQGLLAYVIGTQLLNLVTRGKPTWENEEKEHKWDAWMPDWWGGPGFFISPLSVPAELTHDMIRYSHTEKNLLDAAMRIASNKASPLWRAGKVLTLGTDYNQTQINGAWERIKAAAWALAPTPIPLSPLVKGTAYRGQMQRQLLGSAGFKVEPAPGAQQQIRQKAVKFIEANRPRREIEIRYTSEAPYRQLHTALRMDNPDRIRAAIDNLRKDHKDKDIEQAMRNRMKHPFTGSLALENKFKATLTPAEQELYRDAKAERREEFGRFMELWTQRGGR